MPRKKIIAGNWKMNKSLPEAEALIKSILSGCSEENSVTKIFFPPSLFIEKAASLCNGKKNFFAGAQNCHQLESGAYTGEISAGAIASCGAKYVLVGHSERRIYFNESPEELRTGVVVACIDEDDPYLPRCVFLRQGDGILDCLALFYR